MNINHKDHDHVHDGPEGKLARAKCRARYTRLQELSHLMSGMGNMVSELGEHQDAKVLWDLGGKYKRMARELQGKPSEVTAALKTQLAESLPDATAEQIDELYQIGVEAGRRINLKEGASDDSTS